MQYSALFQTTPFFGIKLWIIILSLASLLATLTIVAAVLCIVNLHRQRRHRRITQPKPNFCSQHVIPCGGGFAASPTLDIRLLSSERISFVNCNQMAEYYPANYPRQDGGIFSSGDLESGFRQPCNGRTRSTLSLSSTEIEAATGGFADRNGIGIGDHGGVSYCGVLFNNTRVAVVKLPTKSCEADKLMMGMDLVGHAGKHKNLVQLLGYCVEGDHRLIVTEYVDSIGNLHEWLHQHTQEEVSPLSWDMRMNILQGVAKGLAYLHEDVEPKIVHGHLKSSSILLDRQWDAKISNIGISKLLECPGATTQYSTESDVYSFGVLVMETICGRLPVNECEGSLIEWLKSMVADGKALLVADPKLPEMPTSKALKRMLLVGLRCVDPDTSHRPTMGEVVHMMEPNSDLLFMRSY
ncbi:Probable serine/threonine-protein kinase At1g01540 [Linum grandiflorum]